MWISHKNPNCTQLPGASKTIASETEGYGMGKEIRKMKVEKYLVIHIWSNTHKTISSYYNFSLRNTTLKKKNFFFLFVQQYF